MEIHTIKWQKYYKAPLPEKLDETSMEFRQQTELHYFSHTVKLIVSPLISYLVLSYFSSPSVSERND